MFISPLDLRIPFDHRNAPQLLVFVDTEEEFSWDSFSSRAVAVRNIAQQFRTQAILEKFGVRPTYLIDYPVASQRDGIAPLKELLDDDLCGIGAQLHGWVNPPIEEEITTRNTFQCNLPARLEHAKIAQLTRAIRDNFGVSPKVFKAGRNGLGHRTVDALIDNGYRIDNSVLPYADLSPHGPDFTGTPIAPFWLEPSRRILEIPTSAGLVGLLQGMNGRAAQALLSKVSATLKLPAFLSRLGLLDRIRLTPEGISIAEAKRLTLDLLHHGQRLFVIFYHSSSLLPGSTPYVRDSVDLTRFLRWLEEYLAFFFGPLGGCATTPEAVLDHALHAERLTAPADELTACVA